MVSIQCFGKQEFKSRVLAQKVANRTNRRNQGGHAGRQVYRCFRHEQTTWHIGNNFLRRDKLTLRRKNG